MSASDDGDYYLVNGSKIWTTLAHWADWIFCLVRTSRGERKQAGITFLCVEMSSPGVTVHPITTMNGAHELNRVTFDNVRVPKINRIGEEGKGWHYANVLLGKERLSYAHIGKKKADLRRVKAIASELPSDRSGSLLEDPLISADIASLEAHLVTLEISVLRGVTGDLNPVAISALKIACTECAQRITELLMLVAGRSALAFPDLNKDDWAQALGCTPAFGPISASDYLLERAQSIYGGTNEIQKNIIWKSLSRG